VVFYGAFHGDMGSILRGCDAAPAGSVGACYRGIGKQTLGRMRSRPEAVVRICASRPAHAADCIGGMVESYVDEEWKADSALAFCASVPGAMRDPCFRAVGERVAWIDPAPAAIRAACAGAGAHAALCVAAAEAEHAADALPRESAASPRPAGRAAAAAVQPRPASSRDAAAHRGHTPGRP
jgi:hypothetical protein